eukprot:4454661-Pleurochrysis_carterae.AAC.5
MSDMRVRQRVSAMLAVARVRAASRLRLSARVCAARRRVCTFVMRSPSSKIIGESASAIRPRSYSFKSLAARRSGDGRELHACENGFAHARRPSVMHTRACAKARAAMQLQRTYVDSPHEFGRASAWQQELHMCCAVNLRPSERARTSGPRNQQRSNMLRARMCGSSVREKKPSAQSV